MKAAVLGLSGPNLTADEAAFFARTNPWGFILFARNVDNPAQVRALTADLRACVGRDAPIFVDQEGGRVQRLRSPHWSEWLPPLDMVQQAMQAAKLGQGAHAAIRAMELRYRLIAAELMSVGIDANCAPCLDVASADTHPFLRNRCFSDDPAFVAQLGRAAANGHLAGGVLPVIKHMPGHGQATMDSHKDLPHVGAPLETLQSHDFAPFRALNDLPIAMTAHIVYAAIDPDHPATTSPKMVRMMREGIGFGGVLLSDDLSMNALAGSLSDRTAATLAAGVDVALHCNGDMDEMAQVIDAAGPLTHAATTRCTAALALRHTPETIDIAALRSDLAGLVIG
jgi:beta-N-acetylhexosaminidase